MGEEFTCAWCGSPVYRNTAKINRNRTGLYFCDTPHRDLYLKKNGPLQMTGTVSLVYCQERSCPNLILAPRPPNKKASRKKICSLTGSKPDYMRACPLQEDEKGTILSSGE